MKKENPEILKSAYEDVLKQKVLREVKNKKPECNHTYPNGKSAIMPGCCMSFCMLCDWDNY
jgi:hypothetical protein